MKGLVGLLILLLTGVLPSFSGVELSHSKPEELEIKVLEKLFQDMLERKNVKVFIMGDRKDFYEKNIKEFSRGLRTVSSCGEADIVLMAGSVKSIPEECLEKPAFSTKRESIDLFKNCLGAFYWKKGRPNIILIKERLEKRGIKLPPEYGRFIESEKGMTGVERGFKI